MGWNLVSMPLFLAEDAPEDVFPGAVVYAWYADRGQYDTPESIEPWRAYWVKATEETPLLVSQTGFMMTEYVADLGAGWHMLGGTHGGAVSLASVASAPAGGVMSTAYRWNAGEKTYGTDTELQEGVGCWVAAMGECWLEVS